jgi:DNA topoisomerase-2
VPIIPFALMNGISGIGTGFSCSIPSYNPLDVVAYLKRKLAAAGTAAAAPTTTAEFIPYYEGFKGSVQKIADQKYLIKGLYEKIGEDKIRITELPVGTWTMPYTTFLEGLMDGVLDKNGKKSAPEIKDFTSICTEVNVDITVTFPRGRLSELEGSVCNDINGVEKLLKLTTTVSSTNMHMFNHECKLHKYASVEEIIDEFYNIRLDTYQKRKDYLISDMQRLLTKLSNRAKYILANLDGTIDLRRKNAMQVNELLEAGGYVKLDGDYKYLIKMPMDSVTTENVAAILKEKETTEHALATLIATTLQQMWLHELDIFEKEYAVYKRRRETLQLAGGAGGNKPKTVKPKTTKVVVKK